MKQSEEIFRTLYQSSSDAIMTLIPSEGFIGGNPAAVALFGCSHEQEFITLNPAGLSPEFQPDKSRSVDKAQEVMSEALEEGFCFFEWMHMRLDGSEFLAEVLLTRMDIDGKKWLQATVRDITSRRTVELKLGRLTKIYAALSQCNQAIVRCGSESELFPVVCRDAVNFGGMKMAWIGMLDEEGQLIKPVASFGTGIEYLEQIKLSISADKPSGGGPAGIAMREERPFWCQDFQNDPVTAVWHERGARFGWSASAALPLYRKGVVAGIFCLYADEINAFDDAERSLLVEMALDISYALDNFDHVAEQKKTEVALRNSEAAYRAIFDQAAVGIARVALDGKWLEINKKLVEIVGYSRHELLNLTFQDITHPSDLKVNLECDHKLLSGSIDTYNVEKRYIRKSGAVTWVNATVALVYEQNGSPGYFISVIEDINTRKQNEARIRQLAYFDQLTGLPNRSQLQDRSSYSLSLAQRSSGQLAVMFLDLDHFKNINDTLGHSIGDQLLIDVAFRLKALLRNEDTLSRQGGDEFILVLPGTDEQGARQVAEKVIATVAQPYHINQHELLSTVSIGIAVYPYDGQDLETLSKNADAAMYRVKQATRNDFCFFTEEMQVHSARTLRLVNALSHALERHELQLHYQPQTTMQGGRIVGAEALLRWQHPELGAVSPAEFIPIAEENGFILQLGEWVLRTAVNQLKAWMDAGLPPMVIAVNLSAVQFRHPNLFDMVMQILNEAKLPSKYLELELTEATMLDDPQAAIAIMDKLHKQGIRMSIDDFGTGYSSLSYLKKFKVYKLKIDQSFVYDLSNNSDDKAIVTAIINLARSMNMITIAEGVETESQLEFLREQLCDEVQGFYFSKPLPTDQFEDFIRNKTS